MNGILHLAVAGRIRCYKSFLVTQPRVAVRYPGQHDLKGQGVGVGLTALVAAMKRGAREIRFITLLTVSVYLVPLTLSLFMKYM